MDERSRIKQAKKEGLEQGRAEGMAQGVKQGKAEGVVQGRDKEKLEIAKHALEEGIETALIQRLTGLADKEIDKLAKEKDK